jgi:hypothetical protein
MFGDFDKQLPEGCPMPVLQIDTPATTATTTAALQRLETVIAQLRAQRDRTENFAQYEEALHAAVMETERELLAEDLMRLDIDAPRVVINGQVHHRALRTAQSYTTAAGAVTVLRTLYRTGKDPAVVPLELRAGIVEGQFTPQAARQAAWAVAHVTPQEAEDLFRRVGNMTPSKSSLDRLPKRLSECWEAQREGFEQRLREALDVPRSAVTVSVSLDGVMTPMKDGQRQTKRAQGRADGKRTKGPAGYQEAGCGTVSFFDAAGARLSTVRMARMPESKKRGLKAMLTAEVEAVLAQRPDLTLVKLADGAKDNWSYLSSALPAGEEIIDFYHAAEHLNRAFAAAYGENTPAARAQTEKYRHILLKENGGVEKLIRALVHLSDRHPRRRAIATELAYFRQYRHRMRYAEAKARHLPVGSGVVEAACKTLVTQRLKRSGMRWRHDGGQAILTLRSLVQSDRFDHGWQMLAATYRANIMPPDNVVTFPTQRVH